MKQLINELKWLFVGAWHCFFLHKKDKEIIHKYENEIWEGRREKVLTQLLYNMAIDSWQKKLKRHLALSKQSLKISCIIAWQSTIVRLWCKHDKKDLTSPRWDFMKQQGYRGCCKCQITIFDSSLTFDQTNKGVTTISA